MTTSTRRQDTALSVQVLGGLTASRDGRALDLGGRRQRAVLGLLVVARGEAVSTDRLIDSVWNGRPPAGAANALKSYVSHLRRGLDPDREARSRTSAIESSGFGYALALDEDGVDAWRFERLVAQGGEAVLREALALWRGPAFAEYAGEEWAEIESARLAGLRELARDQLAAARLARGEAAVLVPELETLVSAAPLREERWRLLVLAQYRAGRQGDALATLRRARKVLADELGVEPGPALRDLEREVLAQTVPVPRRAAEGPRAPEARHGDLVDRDGELAELRGVVADALAGDTRLVLVEGPPGIGKTRLLTEARRLAADAGARVLTARGSPLEREYGFGAVRQLFEEVPRAGAAAALFDGGGAETAAAVMHALYRLTVDLAADGPLVLAVDDLQWCDAASLRFLLYLAHRMEGLPLLVVATLRTGERHEDEDLIGHLTYDPLAVRLRPGPLSPAGVADLVRTRLGDADDAFAEACHRATSCNPLLVRQLIRALQSERVPPDAAHAATVTEIGSRAVASLVLMRLARMPAPAPDVAHAVAVLGGAAELPVVAALAGVPEEAAAAATAALARAEILRDDYPLGFVHPLVAEAVYRDLAPGRRQLQHARAARLLADAGAAEETVAAQLLQVPPRADPWVVDVLRRAAARARDRAAPDAAAVLLTRALREPPVDRTAVLLELGHAEAISNAVASIAHLREAYELAADPVSTVDLALTLGRTLVFAGEPGAATRFAREAARRLPADSTDDRQALLATERIGGYLHDVDPADWRRDPAPEVAGTGRGARMLAVALAWEAVMDGVDRRRAVELARFGVADGTLLRADTGLLWVIAGQVLDLCDEDPAPLWDAGLVQADQRGDLFTRLAMQLWRGYMLWGRGDLREAHQLLAAGNEMSHTWAEGGIASGYGESFLLGVLVDGGDLGAARAHLEHIRPNRRVAEGARLFGHAQARLLLAEGRYAAALRSLDDVRDVMATVHNPAWRPWRSLRAAALAGLGRDAEARELVDAELDAALAWGAPRVVARTLRLRGVLSGHQDDLRDALDLLGAGTARVEEVRTLLALSRLTDREEAARLLRRAIDLAGPAGADGLHRDAAAALAALGLDAPARPPAVATLSSTERRILERHLAGVDDREIADALFLTPRSVRVALDSIRTRLRASSRAELRSALEE